MSSWLKVLGFINDSLKFNKGNGFILKDNSEAAEFYKKDGTTRGTVRVGRLGTSPGSYDIPVNLDVRAKVIGFNFVGDTPPAAGTNTGKFGFCKTSGSSNNANDVVFDDGSNLLLMPRDTCMVIFTDAAISGGTVNMNANGVYVWTGSAYELNGDGTTASSGQAYTAKVPIVYNSGANVDSTQVIPENAIVLRSWVDVTTAFNGTAPTLEVKVNGSTPKTLMITDDIDLKTVGQYNVLESFPIAAANTGVVRGTYTASSSSAGAADIYVEYSVPSA